jgi:ABC-type multidrug transport system fused ATPase/permease subunit
MQKDNENMMNNNLQLNFDFNKLFKNKLLAQIGLIIIIFSIIGLIVSYTVPWAYFDYKNSNLDDDEKFFGHNLENEDDVHLAEIYSAGGLFGFESYRYSVKDYTNYLDGTPFMADFGLILLCLVGVLFIVLTMFEDGKKGFILKLINFFKYSIALGAIFPALMVFLSGIRFVGLNINSVENAEVLESYMLKDLTLVFPAAYIMLFFGVVFLVLLFLVIKPDVKSVIKLKDLNKKRGNMVLNSQRFAMLFIFLSIIGLVFMPLFPWITTSTGDDSIFLHEDDVMFNGEIADDLEDDLREYRSQKKYLSSYNKNYYSYDDGLDETADFLDAMIGLKDNLSGIGLFFWLGLFFSILVLIGVEIFNLGNKYHVFGNILLLLGVIVLIASVLIILNHAFFVSNIGEISEFYEDLPAGDEINFGFNYFPLLAGIFLLLTSLLYTLFVFPLVLKKFLYNIK